MSIYIFYNNQYTFITYSGRDLQATVVTFPLSTYLTSCQFSLDTHVSVYERDVLLHFYFRCRLAEGTH